MSEIKKVILELAEIAKACPDNLQQTCFELLLKDYLGKQNPSKKQIETTGMNSKEQEVKTDPVVKTGGNAAEIVKSALHIKANKFLEKYSITIDQINNLFYKEGESILPLFDDLKTNRLAESQIRIALLQCLHSGLTTGEFNCKVELVRQECNDRKCYATNNFGGNFRNNIELFDCENYGKDTKDLRLSEKGKTELARVIKEMQ